MQPRAPIVLVPGLLGFDRYRVGPFKLFRYFPGIEEELQRNGYRVGTAPMSLTHGVTHRAMDLKRFCNQFFPGESVHIVAHSMGGLDARYMISRLDMHDRVRSLTTIGTPHLGSPFADWGVRHLSRLAKPILNFLGINTDAIRDLTTEHCARLAETLIDSPTVRYHSVAGKCEQSQLSRRWRPVASLVADHEGENDGVVSVRSAQYGQSFEVWTADHMHLVNRPNPRATDWGHRPSDYVRLVRRVEP